MPSPRPRPSVFSVLAPLFLCIAIALLGAARPAAAQTLNVYMSASSEVVGPGDRTAYTLIATNTGSVDLTNVTAEIQFPDDINRISFPPPSFSCSVGCDAGETATWAVGTLGPGESQTVFYQARIQNAASAGMITSSVTASAMGVSDAMASLDVVIDDSPLLRLGVAPESGPAVADESFTYTLTFGNIGSKSPTDVVLTMPIPGGTSFVSTTGGGTESNGTVTWDIGLLAAGASEQVQLTVVADAALDDGEVLKAEAEIDPNEATEPVARSSVRTPVRSEEPLRLEYAVSQTSIGAGDPLTYTLTATNTGPVDLTNASARILFPGFITRISPTPPNFSCSVGCDANEVATWSIGTLAPGESRTVFFRSFLQGTAPQGEPSQSLLTATSSNTGQVSAALDAHVDPSPLLRLNMVTETGAAEAGSPFTYTLTLGNVGNKNPTNVALSMPVPEGTSFVSASGGGSESGGVVTWDIGLVGVGNSKQVRVTVLPDGNLSEGDLITARAKLDSGDAQEVVVRSLVVTPIRSGEALHVAYSLTQTASGNEGPIDVVLTATNAGPVDLTNASARILFPGFITRITPTPPNFSCSVGCDANEIATWTIGTLAPGESRTVFFRTFVASGAPQGEISHSMLAAESSGSAQVLAALAAIQVDPSPLPRLSIAPDPAPTVAGAAFTYHLSVGNVGTTNATGAMLTVPVPDGTSFVSATEGGMFQNGNVMWDLPLLGPGDGGSAEMTVMIDDTRPDGSQLNARAEFDPGDTNEVAVRSSITTPIRDDVPLEVEYTSSSASLVPGDQFTYTLEATNTGPADLTGAEARILFPGFIDRITPTPPDFSCSVGCDANEIATWTIGTLAPGESKSVTFEPTVNSTAPGGNTLRSLILATATGSNEVMVQRDIFLGNDVPLPVELASFTGTSSGETVTLSWTTASETNNAGFDVERSTDGTAFTKVGFETGRGTTTEAQTYRFVDADIPFADTLFYRLRQVDLDGTAEYSSVVRVGLTPQSFELLPNAPNPFHASTELRYTLTEDSEVSLRVYDVLGRRVRTLVDTEQSAGRYTMRLDGTNLPSGMYFVRLQSGTQMQTQQIAVVR